ncbi:MAG: endolytic transglycosylase MltG [Candidatus Moraniibacteriota bacterium]|jgi:peptidoglycan lytic transglycosylase G
MKKYSYIVLIVGIIIVAAIFVNSRTYNTSSQNKEDVIFVVKKGDDVIVIGRELVTQDLIANRFYLYYYMWKNKLRGSIAAGEYNIKPASKIEDIMYKITSGDAVIQKKQDIKITFPEGWTVKKMVDRLNENKLPGDNFATIAATPSNDIYDKYDFLKKGESLEGYLYPDTYFFTASASADIIVGKMLDNFSVKVDENHRKLINDSGNNLHDVIILASIVEGEVPIGGDRRLVAGIFQNRLDINMALQSDATIDYIKGIPEMKHSLADIEIDSPYNTYKYPGLPAGPINNPSVESIEAVMSPTETDYMYFLNNVKTGETVFSRTFDEHISNKYKNGL